MFTLWSNDNLIGKQKRRFEIWNQAAILKCVFFFLFHFDIYSVLFLCGQMIIVNCEILYSVVFCLFICLISYFIACFFFLWIKSNRIGSEKGMKCVCAFARKIPMTMIWTWNANDFYFQISCECALSCAQMYFLYS